MINATPEIAAHIPSLRRYARVLVRDVAAADDLVQECLARALAKLDLWGEGDLQAWLFTILHNQYVNEVRRSPRTRRMVVFDEDLPRWLPAIQEKRHELRDLDRALAQLSAGQRAVILLVGWEGISYRDVSAILGITRGTVRSRLSRARGALRCLRPTAPTPLLD